MLRKFEKKRINEKDVDLRKGDLENERLLKVKRDIDKIDLESITPLEALNILHGLKSDI